MQTVQAANPFTVSTLEQINDMGREKIELDKMVDNSQNPRPLSSSMVDPLQYGYHD